MKNLSRLLYLQLILAFTVDFLIVYVAGFPRVLKWVPELLGGMLFVGAVLYAASRSLFRVPVKYVVWGSLMLFLIVIGIVANQEPPGAVFYGIRKYFRYAPLLLLPLLVDFPDKTRIKHLTILLLLAFVQLPVSVYQRLFSFFGSLAGKGGDTVRGTLSDSGLLTVFLLMTLMMWTALYLRKNMALRSYLLGVPFIVVPTWINETTANLLFLPLAVILPFLMDQRSVQNIRRTFIMLGVLLALGSGFYLSYIVQFDRWGGNPLNAISEAGEGYLYRGADENSRADGTREHSEIGRLDSVVMPFLVLKDPIKVLIGVGVGNASTTFNEKLEGDYSKLNDRYGIDHTTYTMVIWEMGVIGLLLALVFLLMVFVDARKLSLNDGLLGAVGLGCACFVPFLLVCSFYKNFSDSLPFVSALFLVFGNVIMLSAKYPLRASAERGVNSQIITG